VPHTQITEEKIESIGGSFAVRTYPDYTEFTFSFLGEYLEDALQLLSEILLRPTFPRIEIRRSLSKQLNSFSYF